MGWSLSPRHHRKPARRPYRRAVRPAVEHLEPRLAPANVAVLSGHYDAPLSGWNKQETALSPATVNST